MHNGSIRLDEISKIEGHARLSLDVKNGRPRKVHFRVSESNRFFERIVVGRHYTQLPLMVSRICGFCNASHCTTAIEAVEGAFNVEISEQTLKLRELLVNGEFIKSHSLHLFFLALPDYLGKSSVLDFSRKQHSLIHAGLDLKNAGARILQLIGGRAQHTTNEHVGAFRLLPPQKKMDRLLRELEAARVLAEDAIALFGSFPERFARETAYVAIINEDYSFLQGDVVSSAGVCIPEPLYSEYLKEVVVPYSHAKQAVFAGKEFMVGALARLNLNKDNLGRRTKKAAGAFLDKFPSHSPFLNNLAQAVEIYQCIDSSIHLISELKLRKETPPRIIPRETVGIGVTEAPRGTLYHKYKFNRQGIVSDAGIIVPTSQNQRNIEEDIKEFLPPLLKLPKEKIVAELEKLIRAYDPCISCASHFLRVDWK